MDLLAADSRRGAKTSACVGLAEIGSALPPIARALRHRSSTRVLMYACVHVPYGPSRPLPPALYSPRRRRTPTVLRQSPCKTDGPRVTPTYLPYSRPIASFASDRDSLPYCPVIGQSHSTPSSRPVSLVLCSLIYPGPDISTTDGLPRTPALNAFLWASSPDRSQAQCYFTYARAAERNRCFRPVLQIYSSPNAEKPPTRIRSTVNVPRQLYAIRRGGNFGYRSATRCFRLRNRSFIGR